MSLDQPVHPHGLRTVPGPQPALHWPSLGRALAIEAGGVVVLAFLTGFFLASGSSLALIGVQHLAPPYLLGWLLIVIPALQAQRAVRRFPWLVWLWVLVLRAAVLFLWLTVIDLVLGWWWIHGVEQWMSLAAVWVVLTQGVYPRAWARAAQTADLPDPQRVAPLAPEVRVAFVELLLLLPLFEPGELLTTCSWLAGTAAWFPGFLLWKRWAQRRRAAGRGSPTWAYGLSSLTRFWLAGVAVALVEFGLDARHEGGLWAMGWFGLGVISIVWLWLIGPMLYAYANAQRPLDPASRPRAAAFWALITAVILEVEVVTIAGFITGSAFDRWLPTQGSLLAIALAWLLVRIPVLLLARRGRPLTPSRWFFICLASVGFAPLVFYFGESDTVTLATRSFHAAVGAALAAWAYRSDLRARASFARGD